MDAVLGLSMTPTTVGLVLVEGQGAEGATMDKNEIAVHDRGLVSAVNTSEKAAAAVLRTEAIAAARGHRLHSIGVTWSEDADTEASLLLDHLSESGFDNVVAVRLPEATEALARGIASVIGHEITAVCVIEPDAIVVLVVDTGDGAVQTAVSHAVTTDEDLARWLSSIFAQAAWRPEALVLVGSCSDLDAITPHLEDVLSVPVFVPAEAQLALARGAAMASTHGPEFFHDSSPELGACPNHTSAALADVAFRRGWGHVGCRRGDFRGFRFAGDRPATDVGRGRESGGQAGASQYRRCAGRGEIRAPRPCRTATGRRGGPATAAATRGATATRSRH